GRLIEKSNSDAGADRRSDEARPLALDARVVGHRAVRTGGPACRFVCGLGDLAVEVDAAPAAAFRAAPVRAQGGGPRERIAPDLAGARASRFARRARRSGARQAPPSTKLDARS